MAKTRTAGKAASKRSAEPTWPDDIFKALKAAGVRQVAYVPDAGHARLIEACHRDNTMRAVPLTSEQEGVALLAGADLGGERGVMLMQSSGVGNVINMLGMARECRFPLLMVVTMRGQWGEFNPWQVPMGEATRPVLEAAGVIVEEVEDPERIGETVAAMGKLAFDAGRMVAVLISQRVIGFKNWSK